MRYTESAYTVWYEEKITEPSARQNKALQNKALQFRAGRLWWQVVSGVLW